VNVVAKMKCVILFCIKDLDSFIYKENKSIQCSYNTQTQCIS